MRDGGLCRRAAWRGVGGTIPAPAFPWGKREKGNLAARVGQDGPATAGLAQACAVTRRGASRCAGLPREGAGGRFTLRARASRQHHRARARNAPHLWRAGVRGEAPAPLPGAGDQRASNRERMPAEESWFPPLGIP